MRHYYLDRIVELERGSRAVGLKTVALNDDAFHEHFPGNPVLPGIYILEGMAQTGGVLLTRTLEDRYVALMVSIDRARFSSFARPGDVVRMAVEIESLHEPNARVLGTAPVLLEVGAFSDLLGEFSTAAKEAFLVSRQLSGFIQTHIER